MKIKLKQITVTLAACMAFSIQTFADSWDTAFESDFSTATSGYDPVDIATISGDVYVAINYQGLPGAYIWKWTALTGTWSAGTNSYVQGDITAIAPAPSGSLLYVAGHFSSVGASSVTAHDLAQYNILTGAWAAVGTASSGFPAGLGTIYALSAAADARGTYVYVGGRFDSMAGTGGTTNIARWNVSGGLWQSLNNGVQSVNYIQETVWTLVPVVTGSGSQKVYVGGNFSGHNATNVAVWDDSTGAWGVFGQGLATYTTPAWGGYGAYAQYMCRNSSGTVYITGRFDSVNGSTNVDFYGHVAEIDKAQIASNNTISPWYPYLSGDTTSSPDYQISRGPIVAVGTDIYGGYSTNSSVTDTVPGWDATTIVKISGTTATDYTGGGLPNGMIKLVHGSPGFCLITAVNGVQRYGP